MSKLVSPKKTLDQAPKIPGVSISVDVFLSYSLLVKTSELSMTPFSLITDI